MPCFLFQKSSSCLVAANVSSTSLDFDVFCVTHTHTHAQFGLLFPHSSMYPRKDQNNPVMEQVRKDGPGYFCFLFKDGKVWKSSLKLLPVWLSCTSVFMHTDSPMAASTWCKEISSRDCYEKASGNVMRLRWQFKQLSEHERCHAATVSQERNPAVCKTRSSQTFSFFPSDSVLHNSFQFWHVPLQFKASKLTMSPTRLQKKTDRLKVCLRNKSQFVKQLCYSEIWTDRVSCSLRWVCETNGRSR